ncbi:MAG: hypothetical protein V4547_17370 [Bacteroidota bacterium]
MKKFTTAITQNGFSIEPHNICISEAQEMYLYYYAYQLVYRFNYLKDETVNKKALVWINYCLLIKEEGSYKLLSIDQRRKIFINY